MRQVHKKLCEFKCKDNSLQSEKPHDISMAECESEISIEDAPDTILPGLCGRIPSESET